jgi:hypothetical protein
MFLIPENPSLENRDNNENPSPIDILEHPKNKCPQIIHKRTPININTSNFIL